MNNKQTNKQTNKAGNNSPSQNPPAAYAPSPYQPPAMPPRPRGIKTWQIVSIAVAGAIVAIVVIIVGVIALSGSMNRAVKDAKGRLAIAAFLAIKI